LAQVYLALTALQTPNAKKMAHWPPIGAKSHRTRKAPLQSSRRSFPNAGRDAGEKMYQVIGPKKSRALRVLWALEELGAPYDHLPDMPGSDAVKALNPSGKVPVLVVDGAVLTDSSAIMTYLADRHGALIPAPGTIERAHHDALVHTVLDEMDAILWMAARHSFILPEAQRLPAIKDSLRWEWARSLARLAPRIAGDCLMGDEFTIADIICAHCLNWGTAIKFEISPEPVLAYQQRMRDRPAFQRLMA
jgi:glutathione S-transferase